MPQLLQRFLRRLAYTIPGGFSVRPFLHRLRGAHIGKNVWISQYVYLDEAHPEAVTIEDNTTIGINTSIIAHFYWGYKRSDANTGKVHIERNVFIGPHCVILPNVRIGAGAVVLAGTVVTRDVPAGILWGPPKAQPLARVTVPLAPNSCYEEFFKGLRPIHSKHSDK
jgi:acetyltransferase-like isoleucine patch superfamily enzyme